MRALETDFKDLILIEPECFEDSRGFFYESWQKQRFKEFGFNFNFVQDNVSYSKKDVVRGFHYQVEHSFTQLVYVTYGQILDVVIDLRKKSDTFKCIYSSILSRENCKQLLMPKGFGHAFYVISDEAIINYKCTEYYIANDEGGILWDSVNFEWPVSDPIISERDQHHPPLNSIKDHMLPKC